MQSNIINQFLFGLLIDAQTIDIVRYADSSIPKIQDIAPVLTIEADLFLWLIDI